MYDSYTPQKLRARILNHYGSRICITEEINRPPCIYNSGTLIGDVINIAAKHKQMLKDKDMIENPDINEEKILQRAAVILLNEINEVETIPIHPLHPDDISAEKVATVVPQKLKKFLDLVCRGCTNKDRKVFSIAQDIISVNSNGKKRMPKNIGLALSLKNSIRSKEFINYLNNLGHCISYDDVLRIETTWATALVEEGEGYATIPTNVKPNFFTQAASDNGDYGQEILSQHVTNTVLYQYNNLCGSFNTENIRMTSQRKPLRRSISLPSVPMDELQMLTKPVLPERYSAKNHEILQCNTSDSRIGSSCLTAAWILLRITGNMLFEVDCTQCVPPWTGFRKVVTLKVTTPTIIGNCRTLPASPTDINVVYTMLINVRKMLINLGQKDPCVTVDEAVYQLAKQVQWLVPALQDITVRLGGFHRAKNFLGVLGKRMQSTGFGEILEEACLYGPNQVEGK